MKQAFLFVKDKYVNPKYPFQDRLYFLFGTAGVISAGSAFAAAILSGLPAIAAVASLFSFFIMLMLMVFSLFVKDISNARIACSAFLNFFMFPALFWVTGGVDCGMVFYFILGLCVATLILNGKIRWIILALALVVDCATLYMGFSHPEWAYTMSFSERQMDTVSSFLIVALFIIAVILILSWEYTKEHDVVAAYNQTLKRQVITDPMTTLYNQSFLMTTLAERRDSDTAPISIAMFDIDNFKMVNDTYGHLRGNQVLCQFAAILKDLSGTTRIATRYGGDEFLVVLPETEANTAVIFAETVRLTAQNNAQLQALSEAGISVSGGVAELQSEMTVEEFIHLADTRLYTAKRSGKNKIV